MLSDIVKVKDSQFIFAFNATQGIQMAFDAGFSGTPEQIHDGLDTVLWTGTSVVGAKFTFDATAPLNGPDPTQAIQTNNAAVNDIMQIENPAGDVDLSNFVAITASVNIDKDWEPNNSDSISIYGFDTNLGQQVGNKVLLQTYFNEIVFDTWQAFAIPLIDMGLETSTVDAFRIEIESVSGAKGPNFFLDVIQLEETGNNFEFDIIPDDNTIFSIDSIAFTIINNNESTLADASMPAINPDEFNGLTSLPFGITFENITNGIPIFSASIRNVGDSLIGGARLENTINTNGVTPRTSITLETFFTTPVRLNALTNDKIVIIISDDLSSLISFTVVAKGGTINT